MRKLESRPGPVTDRATTDREREVFRHAFSGELAVLTGRAPTGRLIVVRLAGPRLWIGRRPTCEVHVEDPAVSRLHARLDEVHEQWVLVDDGISTHGTTVNDHAVRRAPLSSGDVVRVGVTYLRFWEPAARRLAATREFRAAPTLSAAQHRVLLALDELTRAGAPATNRAIAERLGLGAETVRTHLKAIAAHVGVAGLPPLHQRTALLAAARRRGLIDP